MGKRALKSLDTEKIKPNSDVSLYTLSTVQHPSMLAFHTDTAVKTKESIRRKSPGLQEWPDRQVQDPGAADSRRTVIERPGDPEKGAQASV